MKKHSEKKPVKQSAKATERPENKGDSPELPLAAPVTDLIFADGGKTSVRAEIIENISGFGDQALRRLGAKGVIPVPVKARWPLELTIKKLFAHMRGLAEVATDDSRFEKMSFPSMEACEARTGIPKTFQQTAKENGCQAFDNSRVNLALLLRWTFKHGSDGEISNWTQHLEKFRSLNEEADYKEKIGELVSREELRMFIQSLMGICFNALRRWRRECPREWEKRDKEYLSKSALAKERSIIAEAQSKLESLKLELSPAAGTDHE